MEFQEEPPLAAVDEDAVHCEDGFLDVDGKAGARAERADAAGEVAGEALDGRLGDWEDGFGLQEPSQLLGRDFEVPVHEDEKRLASRGACVGLHDKSLDDCVVIDAETLRCMPSTTVVDVGIEMRSEGDLGHTEGSYGGGYGNVLRPHGGVPWSAGPNEIEFSGERSEME